MLARPHVRHVLLVVGLIAGAARAQSRSGDALPAAAAPIARCNVHGRIVEFPSSTTPDARVQVAVAAMDEHVLLAWRSQEGALELTRLGSTLVRVDDDRELARPVGPFAMTTASDGTALALVQRPASGDDMVVLARVSSMGEAQNVPRVLARAHGIDGIAIASTSSGFAVAWGVRGEAGGGTFLITTDARGVPTGPSRHVLDGTSPRLAWLASVPTLVVSATASTADSPTAIAFDNDGTILDRVRLEAIDRATLVGPAGASLLALGARADVESGGGVMLQRWIPGAEPNETLVALRLGAGSTIVSAIPDRAGALLAVDDTQGHESVIRLGIDGTTIPLYTRTAALGALTAAGESAVLLVVPAPDAAGTHGISVQMLACPRPAPLGAATNADAQSPTAGTGMP